MGIIKYDILFIVSQSKLAYDQSMKIVLGVSRIERSKLMEKLFLVSIICPNKQRRYGNSKIHVIIIV